MSFPSLQANGTFYGNLCNLSLAQGVTSVSVTGVTIYQYPKGTTFTTSYDDNCEPVYTPSASSTANQQTGNLAAWTVAPNTAYPNYTITGASRSVDLYLNSMNMVVVNMQVTTSDSSVYTVTVQQSIAN